MKKVFAIVAAACFLLTAFLPVFTLTKGPDHVIGHLPLLVVYPGLIDIIHRGYFDDIPLPLSFIGLHLFLSLATAWIVVRILKRRKQKRAEQGGPGYPPQGVGSPDP